MKLFLTFKSDTIEIKEKLKSRMWKIKYSRENTFRPKLLKPGVIFLSGFNYLI